MAARDSEAGTLALLRMIGCPLVGDDAGDVVEDERLFNLAVVNKIPLLYLERLAQRGRLDRLRPQYEEQQRMLALSQKSLVKASSTLRRAGIAHVFFKTVKPFPSVPGDIDVLTLGGDPAYLGAIGALLREGFRPQVGQFVDSGDLTGDGDLLQVARRVARPTFGVKHVSPNGVDLVDPETNFSIDLQRHFGMSYLVFIDSETLVDKVTIESLPSGVEVALLPPGLDLGIVIVHSMMEQLFLLGEFYSLASHLSRSSNALVDSLVEFLHRNKATHSLRRFAGISAALCQRAYGTVPQQLGYLLECVGVSVDRAVSSMETLGMPSRYSGTSVFRLLAEKTADPVFRASLLTQLTRMADPRLASQVFRHVLWYRTRKAYLKGPRLP